MASLEQFLKSGSLGPIVLGTGPFEVIEQIGDPEQQSRKANPLILKYGSLQLMFWRNGPKSQLREIAIHFQPHFEPPPPPVDLEDFPLRDHPSEQDFYEFISDIQYPPASLKQLGTKKSMLFLSGVTVEFSNGLLHIIRHSQKEKKETTHVVLSDTREPSQTQILDMIHESEAAIGNGARRSALVMAWAALEATLRQTALRLGRHGQIGVQPTILIRELVSAGLLSPETVKRLEELRQLRTATVHGLAPLDIPTSAVLEMHAIARQLLADREDR
ncbi:MAG: hypothetical protein GIKADHBN_02978 [Phycisphaerales bacterium]|nr:hypothetical protein [Phycisphaerales bacterium]